MPFYRLAPRRDGAVLTTVVALAGTLLLAPIALEAISPFAPRRPEPVELSVAGTDIDISIPQLSCRTDPLVPTMSGWRCGQATVQFTLADAPSDPTLALRRAVRGYVFPEMPDGQVHRVSETRILVVPESSAVALSVPGSGDDAELYVEVLIDGPAAQVTALAEQFWAAMSSFDAGAADPSDAPVLPPAVREELSRLPDRPGLFGPREPSRPLGQTYAAHARPRLTPAQAAQARAAYSQPAPAASAGAVSY